MSILGLGFGFWFFYSFFFQHVTGISFLQTQEGMRMVLLLYDGWFFL